MCMTEVINVFVVTFNRVEYLKQSLNSIINQSYKNIKITVLDNCSTDGTELYVKSIDDKRIHYIKHDHNIGGRDNIEFAFSHCCNSKYFAIFHDDDVLHPNLIEEELKYLEMHDDCVAVSCLRNIIDENGQIVKTAKVRNGIERSYSKCVFFYEYLNHQTSFTFPATLYRTDFILDNAINVRNEPGPCADVVVYMDIEKAGGTVAEIPKPLIDYRVYKQQDSSSHLEEMLIQLIDFLSQDDYYSKLLSEDVVGRKKYLRWYFNRLLIRMVSECISYGDAKRYFEDMKNALDNPEKHIKIYSILLRIVCFFHIPANMMYKVYKKVKSKK